LAQIDISQPNPPYRKITISHTIQGSLGPKITPFKNQHDGDRHLEFSIYGHISVVNKDILVKFCTLIDIGHTSVTVAQYPTFGKIQDGGDRRLKSSIFGNSSVVNEDTFYQIWYIDRYWPSERYCSPISHFRENSRWRLPPSWIYIFAAYRNDHWRYLSKIWYVDRHWPYEGH